MKVYIVMINYGYEGDDYIGASLNLDGAIQILKNILIEKQTIDPSARLKKTHRKAHEYMITGDETMLNDYYIIEDELVLC